MKSTAYWLTGSAGLLSDALESGVNLLAAITAGISLWYAAKPADKSHTFGHEKVEFFSSGLEGALICVAGIGTIYYALLRLLQLKQLTELDSGTIIAFVASIVNLLTAAYLIRIGKKHRSIVLMANGKHLLTDVYTSLGVVFGLLLVRWTGITWLDPVIAFLVGSNILLTGGKLIWEAFNGLMDRAIPENEQNQLRELIRHTIPPGTDFHGLRTRKAGRRTFAEFHLLMNGKMKLSEAHAIGHKIEEILRDNWPDIYVMIHLEPIEEQTSWEPDLVNLGESPIPKRIRDGD